MLTIKHQNNVMDNFATIVNYCWLTIDYCYQALYDVVLVFFLLTLNISNTFSIVYIVDFEQVVAIKMTFKF